jgi:hypothetical protein
MVLQRKQLVMVLMVALVLSAGYVNYRYQESVSAMIGFKIKDIQISYSYDINTMGIAVQGSHEICVSYLFKMDLEKTPRIYHSIRYL